jgi:hypothetical protein
MLGEKKLSEEWPDDVRSKPVGEVSRNEANHENSQSFTLQLRACLGDEKRCVVQEHLENTIRPKGHLSCSTDPTPLLEPNIIIRACQVKFGSARGKFPRL